MKSLTLVGVVGGIIVVLMCLTSGAWARLWYVHPDSSIKKIQAGLDSCRAGDTVRVGPGTYHEQIIWPNTQGIDLISALGPDTTIIDGDSSGAVIKVWNVADSTTTIRGFSIRRGLDMYGGGIDCEQSSPTVSGNIISRNTATIAGGGIFCYRGGAPAIINGNIITRNSARFNGEGLGGGIYCMQTSPIITGNTITSNVAQRFGGGIGCESAEPIIAHNHIGDNSIVAIGGGGAGIYSWGRNYAPRIIANNITGNRCRYGGGIYCSGKSLPIIDSCTISNNTYYGVYNSDSSGPILGYNNIAGNAGYGVVNIDDRLTINVENNWWGDSTGAYHPMLNPGGRGDTVSDYVDFIPWLRWPVVRMEERVDARIRRSDARLGVKPNPCRGKTAIQLSGAVAPDARLEIFDALGRCVRSFGLASLIPRPSSCVIWSGTDDRGHRLPAGVYLLRYVTDDHQETQKLVLLR